MLEHLLKTFIDQMELGEIPTKDEQGAYLIKISPEMHVSVKQLDPGLFFHSPLAALQEQKREELFMFLMKANFLGQGTGGGAIGLDDNEKFLTLSLVIPYDMNYQTFKDSLESFANYVDYWREELSRFYATAQPF